MPFPPKRSALESQQLAAAQTENEQLRVRVQTLETQLNAVLGRGCIITVDVRQSR